MNQGDKIMLTKKDIAKKFSCSKQTVNRWVRSGELRSIRVRGVCRILPEDLQQFIEANASKRAAQ